MHPSRGSACCAPVPCPLQVKYVVELAKAMALHPAVHRVDLLTRLIRDPGVDPEYGVEEECLAKGVGELGGAYIVRLPCGPTEVYVRSVPRVCVAGWDRAPAVGVLLARWHRP